MVDSPDSRKEPADSPHVVLVLDAEALDELRFLDLCASTTNPNGTQSESRMNQLAIAKPPPTMPMRNAK